jgi:hypothetical protein
MVSAAVGGAVGVLTGWATVLEPSRTRARIPKEIRRGGGGWDVFMGLEKRDWWLRLALETVAKQ